MLDGLARGLQNLVGRRRQVMTLGVAHHQRVGQFALLERLVGGQQQVGGVPGEVAHRLAHGGDSRPGDAGDFRIVEPDDRQVARHIEPQFARDLADLGEDMPPRLQLGYLDEAGSWGALYVVEGSRLGGVMLARSVGTDLPSRYLAAAHAPGQWRAIREAIDTAGAHASPDWHDALLAGAAATFELYAKAAQVTQPALVSPR